MLRRAERDPKGPVDDRFHPATLIPTRRARQLSLSFDTFFRRPRFLEAIASRLEAIMTDAQKGSTWIANRGLAGHCLFLSMEETST